MYSEHLPILIIIQLQYHFTVCILQCILLHFVFIYSLLLLKYFVRKGFLTWILTFSKAGVVAALVSKSSGFSISLLFEFNDCLFESKLARVLEKLTVH